MGHYFSLPFWRLDVLGFKKNLKTSQTGSHTVRQAIWGLLLDGYTVVQIDSNFIPSVYARSTLGELGLEIRLH